ncbi:uncharacterized protein Z519_02048 [Cladophialophora bantiana CBS 173.52]|uniref:Uncharacterized protein n=1 Tax=Cladophialophora bantiana (strain ATCC 10958 / CBS 173.52 / CDC B-1940 / NIH 8579) TaxID=1442370 RepID=A0A0D2GE47_CLAB1|nr:uncharacterized protein Z519_02048 [Cladophialophora bantiana CBS 173.52]KIW96657.1 hypothetical protein Z519_02048 [Cladophialophora bantiana CBS 173.52]
MDSKSGNDEGRKHIDERAETRLKLLAGREMQQRTLLNLYVALPVQADPWTVLSVQVGDNKTDRPVLDSPGKQSDPAFGLVKLQLKALL